MRQQLLSNEAHARPLLPIVHLEVHFEVGRMLEVELAS